MPPKPKEKPKIPTITWTSTLVWKLIDMAQSDQNRNVMIGKAKEDNTTADSKVAVFKRVARQVIPAIFEVDEETAGKRTQAKWDSLKKLYRTHAASLIQTGGGVDPDKAVADNNAHHEYSDCYIPASGPDASTTERAKNIWQQIIKDFPYFPEMHRLFSTRPNFNPPAVTTGVGPQGRKTVHYQAPTEVQRATSPVIDPSLIGLTFPPQTPLTPSNTFNSTVNDLTTMVPVVTSAGPVAVGETGDKENTGAAFMTPAKVPKTPKTSAFGSTKLDDAVRKARDSIKPLSAKRGAQIEDAFTTMSRKTLEITQARYREEIAYKRRKLDLEERQLLLREKEAGLISRSEYRKEKKYIGKTRRPSLSPPSSPTQNLGNRLASPDWDLDKLDEEMKNSSDIKIMNGE